MNVLLLSNGAPNYHYFFNSLAKKFHEDGSQVVIAVDSHFSRVENGLDALGFDVHDFSAYFEGHQVDRGILERYGHVNLSAALLSDFERAQVYGVWGRKDDDYFERLKSALLSYFEGIFEKYSIEIVLYENVSNAFAHFAFFVAREKGAQYCGIGGSRLPGRFSVTADPLEDDEPERIFEGIRSGRIDVDAETRNWCEQYLTNIESVVPDYMKINGLDNVSLIKKYVRVDRLKKIASVATHSTGNSYYAFQAGNPLRTYFNLFRRNVARKFKVSLLRNYYQDPVEGEKFLLYPMHFHPESSTSILAGTYLDEYEVIRNIAFNLPQGLKLYVKDHVSAWGYPSLDFYAKLKRLPNVRVLRPNAPTKELIKKSEAVITLTSTVGYEALLLGKKVFLYGSVFYGFHKDVIRITDPSKLFELLRRGLADGSAVDKSYNLDFIAAYFMSTKPSSLNLMMKDAAAEEMAKKVYPVLQMERHRLGLQAK